ncbi:MAG: hypothetical protein FWG28_06880 [Clostridiales bacterium]|nr:hypothetical protein [Clostridiales bacterium]
MNRPQLKALLSSLLLPLLLLVSATGAMLYFGKTGMILGFRRASLLRFHARCSLGFLFFILCHVALNFRIYLAELKKPAKRNRR